MDSITFLKLFRNTPVALWINNEVSQLWLGETPRTKGRPAVRKGTREVGRPADPLGIRVQGAEEQNSEGTAESLKSYQQRSESWKVFFKKNELQESKSHEP